MRGSMGSFRLGLMRHRISIETAVTERNELGEDVVVDWTTVCHVWAHIEDMGGREFQEAQQDNAEVLTRIVIRYRDGILPDMRVVWPQQGNHTYNIRAVLRTDTRKRYLLLMCEEMVHGD